MSKYNKSLSGVSVPHHKNTSEMKIETMPVPDKVYLGMSQHMGAPCEVCVKVGDEVKVGQLVGKPTAFMSAPIHSSVSGKVTAIDEIIMSSGMKTPVVVIEADKLQTLDESIAPPVVNTREEFIEAIKQSGLVGLGGAGFPTHIKFNPKNPDQVDTLVINFAECEPYITADNRVGVEQADHVVGGIKTTMHFLNIKNCIIGVEDNKPEAIRILTEKTKDEPNIKVQPLKAIYPQGGEKVLIYHTTGRVVGEGQLPADVGVIVSNVASIAFVDKYMKTGIPLISKILTVDGDAVANPKNVEALIGTRFVDIINFCGGYKAEPRKILMGGPMMGIAIPDDTYPLLKNNNAVLAFTEAQIDTRPETPCIRCARCINACPFQLMPASIEKAYNAGNVDQLKKLKVNLCMECGCCSYVCPAKRPLVLVNRLSKNMLRASK